MDRRKLLFSAATSLGAVAAAQAQDDKKQAAPPPQSSGKIRITVLQRALFEDLAKENGAADTTRCPVFEEGRVIEIGAPWQFPERFCTAAWTSIHEGILTASLNGQQQIKCCPNGLRPVTFKIEKI